MPDNSLPTALVRIELRYEPTEADWLAADPVLAEGEPAAVLGTGQVKIGDGTRKFSALPYVGGMSVVSVNGKTGVVVLTPADIPGLAQYIKSVIAGTLVQGANVGLRYDTASGKLTISAGAASGGGVGGSGVNSINALTGTLLVTGVDGITVTQPNDSTVQIGVDTGGSFGGTPAVPGAPTGVLGVGGAGQAAVSWSAPASGGASPITSYSVQYSGDSGASWYAAAGTAATNLTVANLNNGIAYIFRVAAANSFGSGPWSLPSAPVTPQASGTAVSQITLSGNTIPVGSPSGFVVGSLGILPSQAGSPVYALPFGALNNSSFAIVSGKLQTAAAMTGAAGSTLSVRVAATTGAGQKLQDFAITLTAVPPSGSAPGTPGSLTAVAGVSGISVSWSAASDNGSPITKYVVSWAPTTVGAFVAVGSTSITDGSNKASVAGLQKGTQYTVQVVAYNALGAGPAASVNATTQTPVITILSQPQSVTAGFDASTGGMRATISVVAASTDLPAGELTYRWQSMRPGGAWVDVAPPTAVHGGDSRIGWDTLHLQLLRYLADNGTLYRVIVSQQGAVAVTSQSAALTVPDTVWYAGQSISGGTSIWGQDDGFGLLAGGGIQTTPDGRVATARAVGGVRTAGGAPGRGMYASGSANQWSGDFGATWVGAPNLLSAAGPGGYYSNASFSFGIRESQSTDGLNWVSLPGQNIGWCAGVRFFVCQTRIIAIGGCASANSVWWRPISNPSAQWVQVALPSGMTANGQFLCAVEANGLIYLFGRGGTYLVSDPGVTAWTQRSLPFADVFTAAAWGGGLMVVVGSSARAAVSSNPSAGAWSSESLPTSSNVAVAYSNNRFAVVGSAGLAIRDVAPVNTGNSSGTSIQPDAPLAPGTPAVSGANLVRYTADATSTALPSGRCPVRETGTYELPWKSGDYRVMQLDWAAPSSGPTPTEYVVEARLTVGTYTTAYPGTPAPVLASAGWPWVIYPNRYLTPIYLITQPSGAPATRRMVYRYQGVLPNPPEAYPAGVDSWFWSSGLLSRWDKYEFRVAAKNGTTQGPWSGWSAPFTLKGS